MLKQEIYVSELTVEGSGEFPIDMLRYDSCVPVTEADSSMIRADDVEGKRQVKLRMFARSGREPTHGRWAAFGWRVTSWGYSYSAT